LLIVTKPTGQLSKIKKGASRGFGRCAAMGLMELAGAIYQSINCKVIIAVNRLVENGGFERGKNTWQKECLLNQVAYCDASPLNRSITFFLIRTKN